MKVQAQNRIGSNQSVAFLRELARPAHQAVELDGRVVEPGCRVRLKPRPGADLMDTALAGRTAVVERIDEDQGGRTHVAVILDDDPGRDLGGTRHPAHRFFFDPAELELLELQDDWGAHPRVLLAGIGNIFLGDDGFGAAVAQRLLRRDLPQGVEAADFGIRGMELAYALGQGYQAAILIDAVPCGSAPGTLHLIEPEMEQAGPVIFDGHRMDPLAVLGLADRLGQLPPRVVIIGCEPEAVGMEWTPSRVMTLSEPVAAAVDRAVDMAVALAEEFMTVGSHALVH